LEQQFSETSPVGHAAGAVAKGFRSLLLLRMLTVTNDNVLRWLAIGLGKRAVAGAGPTVAASTALVLTMGTAGFVLPFVLLAWLAGYLADRYPKRTVIIWCKFAEILIVTVAAGVIAWGVRSGGVFASLPVGLWLLLGSVIVIGCQAALLAPSMLGTISETVPPARLSNANGLFAMVTLVATLVGMAAGSWLADKTPLPGSDGILHSAPSWVHAVPASVVLVGLAVAGWLASLWLVPRKAADPQAPPPWNALARTGSDLSELFRSRELSAAAAGIVFFWGLAAVAQLNVDQFATEAGATSQSQIVPLLLALVSGIGLGSLIAGKVSTQGVNVGLVPFGALLMAAGSLCLCLSSPAIFSAGVTSGFGWWFAAGSLVLLGLGAGIFDVPLEAYFQEQSPATRRGSLLATLNLLVFAGMFAASLLYGLLRTPLGDAAAPLLSARSIFGIFGVFASLAVVLAVYAAPRATLRFIVGSIVNALYRFRIARPHLLPATGPVVIIANHLSWLDGFIVVLSSQRPVRLVVYGPNIQGRLMRMLADQWRFILFEPRPKSIGQALKAIQSGLADGDVIGIFCEGGISRTGQIMGFKRGLEWILERVEAPLLPLHIDGMWGSLLSFSEGRFFTKRPRGWRRPLTLTYGPALPIGAHPDEARLALQEITASTVRRRMRVGRSSRRDMLTWLQTFRSEVLLIDATGRSFTGSDLLVAGKGQSSNLTFKSSAVLPEGLAGACAAVLAGLPLELASGQPLAMQPAANDLRRSLRPSAQKSRAVVVVDQATGKGLDWAALAAGAEAFDGACLVHRTDRLLSSLAPGDPLYVQLGLLGGALLGIRTLVADWHLSARAIGDTIVSQGITLWLARSEQVLALSRESLDQNAPLFGWGDTLQAVIMPIEDSAQLPPAQEAAARFREAFGIEPVVAFAPRGSGGLVAMNTPSLRSLADHELTQKSESVGRVLNGVVVWPEACARQRLNREPLESVVVKEGDARTLLIGATLSLPLENIDSDQPAAFFLDSAWTVDKDGFLVAQAVGQPAMQ